ncbi:CehA/McbA family metallohydrolase [Marinitoga aeolica]|uniref:CehA/McbA family metallohydrolase n=1 Tax=Marinitoga aeolica TaxID=2809031 RepID=A0ABY8PNB0_9BACT|nr:CehA/McbA family metallohydrolase [Marinitoga aeolica]WGS64130.1 CehA/McbA family metallohydrolase [Marinitoga aeolica]
MKKFLLFLLFIVISLLIFSFPSDLILLFGNPHSHTAFSDGEPGTTPSDAYKHARDLANLDFIAVTDHAYYFEADYKGRDKFEVMKEMAKQETTEKFSAIAGFEWTAGVGHINVFEASKWTSRNVKTTIEEFYDWLINEKVIAQFNHPISMFGTFKDFEYYPEVDNYINMIEVGNGSWSKNDTINEEMFSNYIIALKKGWHVGATVGQDNHIANWGTGNDSRTAVWVKEKSKNGILEGFKNKKTYGTEDKNVKLWIETDHVSMGDIYYYDSVPEKIQLKVYYNDPDNEKIKTLSIYTPNNVYKYNNLNNNYEHVFEIPVDSTYSFVFVRIDQYDGNSIVSSPIWYEPKDGIRLFEKPKAKMYSNSENNLNFYIYNIYDTNSKANIKIYVDDELSFNDALELSSYEKKMVNAIIKTHNTKSANIKIYINNILWKHYDINLEEKIKVGIINVNPGFLKGKYILSNDISKEINALIIPSSILREKYEEIIELSKKMKVGIVIDEINDQLISIIPNKFEITKEEINNVELNKLYYNKCYKVLYKGKERGFIINKNVIIFPGNPFVSKNNEPFIRRLLNLK